MSTLQHKIDFALVLRVANANPNGDPLNGNRPRTDYDGIGEITDVCLKRKLRDRLQESGEAIFVQSDDRRSDEHRSLSDRARAVLGKDLGGPQTAATASKAWFDVRAFGQLFAIKGGKGGGKKGEGAEDGAGDTGISIGVRGPVSLQSAFSLTPVEVTSTQITKSASGEGDGSKRGSDTMGMKHRVDHGHLRRLRQHEPAARGAHGVQRCGCREDQSHSAEAFRERCFFIEARRQHGGAEGRVVGAPE